jgi:FkbM family methyltransferase
MGSILDKLDVFESLDSSLCSVKDQKAFYHSHSFHNKNDHIHAQRLSRQLSNYALTEQFTVFIIGLNKGVMLNLFSQCTKNFSAHSFDIQGMILKNAEKKFGERNLHWKFNLLGMSNMTGVVRIGGADELAGLYDEAVVASHFNAQYKGGGFWPRQMQKNVTVKVTTPKIYCEENKVSKVDFMVIDVEGIDSLVIQGMNLEDPLNRFKFSAFQYELGVRSGDPRQAVGSMNQFSLAQYVTSFGYKIFLLGNKLGLQITPEFFKSSNHTEDLEINGNVLAVHRNYTHPLLKTLLKSFKDCTSQTHFDDSQAECSP